MSAPQSPLAAGRVAFTYPSFGLYQLGRFCMVLATEMQSVAVGWQVYEITKRPWDLGWVGLGQFLPGVWLLLFAALRGTRTVYPIYVVLILIGVVRAFNGPVSRALLPQLVPEEHFQNAVAWNASIFQAATILGPSIGGFLYALAHGPGVVYATAVIVSLAAVFSTLRIKLQTQVRAREPVTWNTV